MDCMLTGELQFLKRTDSKDACGVVNEQKKDAMDPMMQTYLKKRPSEVEQMQLAKAAKDTAIPEVGVLDQTAIVVTAFGSVVNVEEEENVDTPVAEEEATPAAKKEATQVEEDDQPLAAVEQEEESAIEDPYQTATEEVANVGIGEEEAATEKVEVEEKVEERVDKPVSGKKEDEDRYLRGGCRRCCA